MPSAADRATSHFATGASQTTDMEIDPANVNLILSANEALVLYEYLARTANARAQDPLVEDQSELRVLWDLESMLESQLASVTAPDYGARLATARASVRDDPN
jgi:hypothetical protein